MAQTTLAASAIDAQVYMSINGSAWSDLSGAITTITPGGGERSTAEAYTLDGDTAAVKAGKRAPVEATIRVLYTEGTAAPDLLDTYWDYYEAGSAVYVKYYPAGSGNWNWTSDAGYITSMTPPEGVGEANELMAMEINFRCPKWTKADS
jgi:hypothetical protein